ncbi:flavin reductase family protein [Nocardioides sp. cx-169]|uniref:flavin reductase family protein n=1 Tax=Nocardioides sp. cx-169 TaxID=2899080 RepID=UPI001E436738|nr:flavin reductase family protein [Nocardioides sp. cx-169]MCD4534246.1 flavin reductase family protein [Nocardioides sp. cx-169]
MNLTLDDPLWKKSTSTVGLVVTTDGSRVNVLSAEWTYFVAKAPISVAVVLHESNWTTDRISDLSEFSVTLCSDTQAHLADFCGSFSGRDIPKTSSDDLSLREPVVISTPWVGDGVMALECVVAQRVELPHYTMVIGLVEHVHGDREFKAPLVKHDAMYSLGKAVPRNQVTVGAANVGAALRVFAVCAPDASRESVYEVALLGDSGEVLAKQSIAPNEYGDLDCFMPVPSDGRGPVRRVAVSRIGYDTGFATPQSD